MGKCQPIAVIPSQLRSQRREEKGKENGTLECYGSLYSTRPVMVKCCYSLYGKNCPSVKPLTVGLLQVPDSLPGKTMEETTAPPPRVTISQPPHFQPWIGGPTALGMEDLIFSVIQMADQALISPGQILPHPVGYAYIITLSFSRWMCIMRPIIRRTNMVNSHGETCYKKIFHHDFSFDLRKHDMCPNGRQNPRYDGRTVR